MKDMASSNRYDNRLIFYEDCGNTNGMSNVASFRKDFKCQIENKNSRGRKTKLNVAF